MRFIELNYINYGMICSRAIYKLPMHKKEKGWVEKKRKVKELKLFSIPDKEKACAILPHQQSTEGVKLYPISFSLHLFFQHRGVLLKKKRILFSLQKQKLKLDSFEFDHLLQDVCQFYMFSTRKINIFRLYQF